MQPGEPSVLTRAPWWLRAAASPWLRLVAGLASVLLPVLLMQWLVALARLPRAAALPLSLVAATLAALLGYRAYVHWIEQRDATELAPAMAKRELLRGAVIGALLMGGSIALLAMLGAYRVDGIGSAADLLQPLGLSLTSGVIEELVLRGLVFRLVEEALGSWWSLGISALLFGLLHMGNPHATLASAFAIALEAGVLLAAAYLLYRRLWLPMGIHAAWNFVQGGVFGVPVSGNAFKGWLHSHLAGPAWLSGGEFGAEASVVSCGLCLAAGLWMLQRAHARGQFVPMGAKTRRVR